jgi:phospholipid/cholesterol/gamma-HCH transport system substrate-binding protein
VSRSLSHLQALILGLVVVVGTVLAGSGLFAVGSRGWYGKNSLNIRSGFTEVRGVEVGTRVRIQGIDAGEVTALEPPAKPGDPVVLCLRLRGEFRHLVRTTSRVQIVNEGLIGGKVVEIRPGRKDDSGSDEPVSEGGMLQSVASRDLSDLMEEAASTLNDLHNGKGSIGKLATDPQFHDAAVAVLQQGKEAGASIQQVADGMQRLPLVGKYVENPVAILERPNCQRDRRVFAEADLFEPDQAILTARGRTRLDEVAPWLEGMKHKGSEVVVVAYADPATHANSQAARILTRQQSEAVCEYLKKKHAIQKMGWVTSRKVTPLGQGVNSPPTPEREPLPPGRVEVLVFVPQQS